MQNNSCLSFVEQHPSLVPRLCTCCAATGNNWGIACAVNVTSDGDVTDVLVEIHKQGGSVPTRAVCDVASQTNITAGGPPVTCQVSYTLADPADMTASIILEATAEAIDTATSAQVNSSVANATRKLGTLSVTGSTTFTAGAPAKTGTVVPLTFTFSNSGPISVGGITLTTSSGASLAASCAGLTAAGATSATPNTTTCTGSYTVQAADVTSTPKALTVTVAQTTGEAAKLQTALPGTVTVNIPTTPLTTSFTTASCDAPTPPAAGSECSFDHAPLHTCSCTVFVCWKRGHHAFRHLHQLLGYQFSGNRFMVGFMMAQLVSLLFVQALCGMSPAPSLSPHQLP